MAAALTIYLLAGMKGIIKVPVKKIEAEGYFPMTGTVTINNVSQTLKRGFCVEDTDIGDIAITDNNALEVRYTHKKSLENTVYFFAATGEMATVHIGSIPIHDHSSVVQGGPAYGTYFSDDEEIS